MHSRCADMGVRARVGQSFGMRSAFLIIDTQAYFCDPSAPGPEGLGIDKRRNARAAYRIAEGLADIRRDHEVIFVGYRATADQDMSFFGAQPRTGEAVFYKDTDNAFASDDLRAYLASRGIGRVYLAGVNTEACILKSLFGGAWAGFTVSVVPDLTASLWRFLWPEAWAKALLFLLPGARVPLRRLLARSGVAEDAPRMPRAAAHAVSVR